MTRGGKAEACKQLGASGFVDSASSDDLVVEVKAATLDGLGLYTVLLLAVSEGPLKHAADYVRPRESIICIGLPKAFEASTWSLASK